MRFTKFVSILATTALACGIAGCSSDDTGNPDDAGGQDVTADASVDTGTDSGKDAGKDSTVTDAKADVAADTGSDGTADATDGASEAGDGGGDAGDGGLPPEGSPCNTPNAIQQEDCGLCGFHKRACLAGGDGGYVWGGWGFCQNQVVNGCDPKTSYPDLACGNCGTKKHVCLPNCNFDATQTCNEPPNACTPGNDNYVAGLSCDAGGRIQTCNNQCSYGPFGACVTLDGSISNGVVTAAQYGGGTISGTFTLPSNPTIPRMTSGTCPSTLNSSSTVYTYIQVNNPHPSKTMQVSIWNGKTLNGSNIDTVMTAYSGTTIPVTDPARKACLVYVSDDCSDSSGTPASCQATWSGLMKGEGHGISIPPSGSILVYVGAYSSSNTGGDFVLTVRTDALN